MRRPPGWILQDSVALLRLDRTRSRLKQRELLTRAGRAPEARGGQLRPVAVEPVATAEGLERAAVVADESAAEVVKLTRIGKFDMGAPASGALAFLIASLSAIRICPAEPRTQSSRVAATISMIARLLPRTSGGTIACPIGHSTTPAACAQPDTTATRPGWRGS